MPILNIKDLLLQAVKYPQAIEAQLPTGAPILSTTLIETANTIPVVPDFPMELPDLPAAPEIPAPPSDGGTTTAAARVRARTYTGSQTAAGIRRGTILS